MTHPPSWSPVNAMLELVRYASEEFRRGESVLLTLLWLLALAVSGATRGAELERWRAAAKLGAP